MGDPISAVEILGPDIATVLCKDAFRPTTSGDRGQEVPLGEGAVGNQQQRPADCAHGIRVLRDILEG